MGAKRGLSVNIKKKKIINQERKIFCSAVRTPHGQE